MRTNPASGNLWRVSRAGQDRARNSRLKCPSMSGSIGSTQLGAALKPQIGERKGTIDRLTGQMTWRTYTNDGRLNDHADYDC